MWEVFNLYRNVPAMSWNPAKSHDESEQCFLGHPLSFDFVMPIELFGKRLCSIELFSKCLCSSISWFCPVSFCDLVTLAIQLIFQKSQVHQSSLTCYINGLLNPSVPLTAGSFMGLDPYEKRSAERVMPWHAWLDFFFLCFFFTLAGLFIFLVSWNKGAAFL